MQHSRKKFVSKRFSHTHTHKHTHIDTNNKVMSLISMFYIKIIQKSNFDIFLTQALPMYTFRVPKVSDPYKLHMSEAKLLDRSVDQAWHINLHAASYN